MKKKYHQIIMRAYEDEYGKRHIGFFIATGQWADGHLAYSRIEDGEIIEDEEGVYAQIRENHSLLMIRI